MLATLVCCICIMCTAVLATYGMSLSSSLSSGHYHEVPACVPFFLIFASCSLLIGAAYYLTVRVSIAAMEALMFDGKGLWTIIGTSEEEEDEYGEEWENGSAAHMQNTHSQNTADNEEGSVSPWSFSSSSSSSSSCGGDTENEKKDDAAAEEAEIEEEAKEEELPKNKKHKEANKNAIKTAAAALERFTFVKVWTNVYGLAVGIFCIVYSLLLPNELSAFTFCSCLWMVGTYECVASTRGGQQLQRKRRLAREMFRMRKQQQQQQQKLQQKQQLPRGDEENQQQQTMMVGREAKRKHSVPVCLCSLLLLGIVLKTAGSIVSGKLVDGIVVADAGGSSSSSSRSWWPALTSVLIPVIGVAAIRNMRKTQDIRTTMELSMPVCSMGSLLCILCTVMLVEREANTHMSCVHDFFWEQAAREQRQ